MNSLGEPIASPTAIFLNRQPRLWINLITYFSVFVSSILGCIWVHRLTPSDLKYPWRVVDSDLSSVYSLAQALGQSWTGLVHHSLGAPFTADLSLAFIPDDLHIEIIRVLVHMTGNPFVAVNLFYVLTFGLCAISFLFLADNSELSRWLSIPLSIAYAWLPYHFTRMDAGHVFLAAYYMVPIGIVILQRLFSYIKDPSLEFLPRSSLKRFLLLLSVVAVGSSGAYYAVFFSLLTFTLVILIPRRAPLRDLLKQFVVVSIVGICFLVAPLSRTIWARTHGLHTVLTRSPEESIQFGGTLSRLLVPWGVWLPEKLRPLVAPMEFEWNAVPLLATIGVWLILISIARSTISKRTSEDDNGGSAAVKFFFLGSLLFYLSSGLSLVFAYGVDSSFRTWNRMSIIILTLALLMVGILLNKWSSFTKTASVSLLVIAVATQLIPLNKSGIGAEPDQVSVDAFESRSRVAKIVQSSFQSGCTILQIPLMPYPEGGRVGNVGDGQHLLLPLLTTGFRWSYGAIKGTNEAKYWPILASEAAVDGDYWDLLEDTCGAVIDRRAAGSDPVSDFFLTHIAEQFKAIDIENYRLIIRDQ